MTRFTIYTYLFKPINQPQEPDMFSPEVKVEESLEMKQELLGKRCYQLYRDYLDNFSINYERN